MTASTAAPKARPTNADLQDQIAEAHECIHKVGEQVGALAETVRDDRHASRNRDQELTNSMELTRKEMRTFGSRLEEIEKASRDKAAALNAMSGQMRATDARVDLLVQFFGLKSPTGGEEPKRRITLGSLEWWQAVLGIAGSVLGALGAWKYLFPALVALHHAILKGS